jgi:hypothetical protein
MLAALGEQILGVAENQLMCQMRKPQGDGLLGNAFTSSQLAADYRLHPPCQARKNSAKKRLNTLAFQRLTIV